MSLLEGETGVVEYPLRSASFASIHSLSLFFVSYSSTLLQSLITRADVFQNESVGDEVSRIYYLGFRGDLRSVKKEIASELEVPAPHTSDASLVNKAANRAAQQPTAR